MGVLLGYVDFNAKSNLKEMTFSQGSYSIGASLALRLSDDSNTNFQFLSAPEIVTGRTSEASVSQRARWEDLSVNYLKTMRIGELFIKMGPSLRQTSWWGSAVGEHSSLQQVNSFGAQVTLPLKPVGHWKPNLGLQMYPWAKSGDGKLNGTSFLVDWATFFEIKPERSFFLNIGYESSKQSALGPENYSFDQRLIKIYFGLLISAN
jgi:hypothetical protein